jgi:cation diffusion facilitator CzcD-associated flavoprotein CzcO
MPGPAQNLGSIPRGTGGLLGKALRFSGLWCLDGQFSDTLTDREANRLASEFIAQKIRQRVKDSMVAEKLIPKNHGLGTRRVPLETGYYEVYNQPNVELVDINETPIERITPAGIKTNDREYEFDIIIYL